MGKFNCKKLTENDGFDIRIESQDLPLVDPIGPRHGALDARPDRDFVRQVEVTKIFGQSGNGWRRDGRSRRRVPHGGRRHVFAAAGMTSSVVGCRRSVGGWRSARRRRIAVRVVAAAVVVVLEVITIRHLLPDLRLWKLDHSGLLLRGAGGRLTKIEVAGLNLRSFNLYQVSSKNK